MKYAIETLEIELNEIKNVRRKQRAISCEYMSAHPDEEHYRQVEKEIEQAISVLKESTHE